MMSTSESESSIDDFLEMLAQQHNGKFCSFFSKARERTRDLFIFTNFSLTFPLSHSRSPNQGILKGGEYHCTIDLLFDWFAISCMTTNNFCFYLQNRLIQASQKGGQQYSDTSPFSNPSPNDHFIRRSSKCSFETEHSRP
jgi:hypothetical protein